MVFAASLGLWAVGTAVAQPAFAIPVTCDGLVVTIQAVAGQTTYGVPGVNDVINGTPGPDVIHGRDGDDHICGLGGGDTLTGDSGNDRIWGDSGEDTIYGNDNDDYIHGGENDDYIRTGYGTDTVYAESGDDEVHCGDGASDFADGGNGGETVGDALIPVGTDGCEFPVNFP